MHSAYPVIAGRFKDYISTPKSNGYQSLHTGVTLREPRNQKIEIQIRTADMNDVAENGVAAHWVYKEPDTKADGSDLQRFRWVQDLLEILENSAAPDEFLENTKLELYQDQVFCFTPKGQLIQLPRGATPVDFAYAVHSQVGDTCVGAKINGRLLPLRHQLQNGDQVEIMTARGGTPSPQWERFVVTGKARARIRRFIHQQQRQQHLDAGRAELTKAFRQAGVDGSEKVLEPALKTLKFGRARTISTSPSATAMSAPKDVVHAAYPELRQTPRAPRMVPAPLPRAQRPASAQDGLRHADHRPGAGHGVSLRRLLPSGAGRRDRRHRHHRQGRDDPCARLPDADRLRRDAGALHRRRLEPRGAGRRRVDGKAPQPHRADQRDRAPTSRAALANLTNAIAKQEGAVANLKIVNRQQDFIEALVDVDVRDVRASVQGDRRPARRGRHQGRRAGTDGATAA